MGNPWKKIFKVVLKTVLWTAGIWLSLLIILETVLSEKVLTGIVNRYAAGYVDGDFKFGKASLSMFRRFPSATITLEDFTITYPADRFDCHTFCLLDIGRIYVGGGQVPFRYSFRVRPGQVRFAGRGDITQLVRRFS